MLRRDTFDVLVGGGPKQHRVSSNTPDSKLILGITSGEQARAILLPQSVVSLLVSSTCYVALPPGASAIRIEDPCLQMLMAAPMRRATARRSNRQFIYVVSKPGTVLLWESWLRHEVPANKARYRRISVSFNYGSRHRAHAGAAGD